MNFYVNATNVLGPTYRLRQDMSWRMTPPNDVIDGDYLAESIADAIRLQHVNREVTISGRTFTLNPDIVILGDDTTLHYEIFVQRSEDEIPPQPSIEQLRALIAAGDEKTMNMLVLSIHGLFELRNATLWAARIIDPSIAVRYETFIEHSNHVGAEAATDDAFIGDVYAAMIEGWHTHLATGETDMMIAN
jgi:hypothetical protein